MDRYIYIKILESIDDEKDFDNLIKAANITPSELKSELSNILVNRYMYEHKKSNPVEKHTVSNALFNLLNPKKRYMLTTQIMYEDIYIDMIGTKEEIIDFLVKESYERIEDMRDETPEYKSVTKEHVQKYYESNFRVVQLKKGYTISNIPYIYWCGYNAAKIDFYDMYLLGEENKDYYFIYEINDIETKSKFSR